MPAFHSFARADNAHDLAQHLPAFGYYRHLGLQPHAHEHPKAEIEELAASLNACGQIEALAVHRVAEDEYHVLCGGRRLKAFQFLPSAANLGAVKSPTVRVDLFEGTPAELRTIALVDRRAG